MLWKKETNESDAWYIDICEVIRKKYRIDPSAEAIEALDNFRLRISSGGTCKDNNQSIKYRRQGDIKMEQQNWYEAIEFYNQSLCYAENHSQHIGLAYAKRAQCFSGLKMFDKCIIDIELAEESNYPADELDQLKKRKEISLKLIEAGAQVKLFEPKLDFEPHENFPEMANILEFRKDEEFGRHLVATADIDVGDVILYEKSFVTIPTECYQYCSICMTAQTNSVPCKICTRAMLCTKCKDNKMHEFECALYVRFKEYWKFVAMGIRTLYVALNLFSNADELMQFVEEAIGEEHELPSAINDSKSKYHWFLRNLETFENGDEMKESEMGSTIVLPFIYRAIIEYKEFNGFFKNDKHRRFFMHLVYYHLIVSRKAANQIDFPIILQFMNHSCIPCVSTFLVDGFVIGVAFRPIRKGEQIFKCYYDCGLTKMTFPQRQQYIRESFLFECKCERCKGKDVPPPALVKSMRSDHNFRLVRQFFDDSNERNQKKRKVLTRAVKAVLRKHYRVVWIDENDVVNAINAFRNLLVSKFSLKMEY